MSTESSPDDPSTARIVIAGVRFALNAQVKTWHETGLEFRTKMRRLSTRLVVVHWSGAENAPAHMHQNMAVEGLSVHFAIDQVGTIWQFCDANVFCAHARGVNDRAIGIELINRGSNSGAPAKGWSRAVMLEKIHGKHVAYAAFTPTQLEACLVLVSTLCRVYRLPMRVPLQAGDVYPTDLPETLLSTFTGVVGHLHCGAAGGAAGRKVDPGLAILRAIHARGAAQENLRT